MPISNFRNIKCDNVDCKNDITFDPRLEKETFEANPWMKGLRIVQTVDQRVFSYCSDVCEIVGVKTGQHNLPVPKKIIEATGPGALQAATQQAQAQASSDKALKSGSGGQVLVS